MTEGFLPFKDAPAFKKQNVGDNTQDVISVWLSPQDRENLKSAKLILRQSKDSTAIKTLMEIGFAKIVNDRVLLLILDRYEENLRKNRRTGVVIESPKSDISNMNGEQNLLGTEGRP